MGFHDQKQLQQYETFAVAALSRNCTNYIPYLPRGAGIFHG